MHETGYTKLFSTIVTSSVWQESKETKILWITMLALTNRYGEVAASEPGLAKAAGLTLQEALGSLKVLESPDTYSRNKENEGRRIAKIDGGWQIINYAVYREKMRKDAEYYRNYRAGKRNDLQPSATVHNTTQPIAKAKAKAKATNTYTDDFLSFWSAYPRKEGKGKAWESWRTQKPPLEQALATLAKYKQTEQWLRESGKYIPHPTTWLNQRRWEDEITPPETIPERLIRIERERKERLLK